MKTLHIINGPNLNLLGEREPEHYGTKTLNDIEQEILLLGEKHSVSVEFFQSNSESEIIDKIHALKKSPSCAGLIINAGAFTHTSIAIMDALKMLTVPVIEVHLSNIFKREEFRRSSYISLASRGVISGLGGESYLLAFQYLLKTLK